MAQLEPHDLVVAVREGFTERITDAIDNALARMEAAGVPATLAEDIARELAHATGSAFAFVALEANRAHRDLGEFVAAIAPEEDT